MIRPETDNSTTIRQIADEIGISHSTVSVVLNGRANQVRISKATQSRVLQAAERLNYVPNHLARGLRGRGTRTVAVIWSFIGPHPTGQMVRDIASRVRQHGYVPYLADCDSSIAQTERVLRGFLQRRVDAVVLQEGTGTDGYTQLVPLLDKFQAVVLVGSRDAPLPYDRIVWDRVQAMREMAEHFLQTGRRRPLVLSPLVPNQQKVQAFLEPFRAAGLGDQARVVNVKSEAGQAGGVTFYRALEQAFAHQPASFDAVFASTDEGAGATMAWLRERGLRVPEDVAVAGFNNSDMAQFLSPPLASVERAGHEVALQIEQMLFARLEQAQLPKQQQQIPMRFVRRASAG